MPPVKQQLQQRAASKAAAPSEAPRRDPWGLVRRYGPQDLAATAALVAVAQLGSHLGALPLAVLATGAELAAFYGIAFWRARRGGKPTRAVLAALVAEYGTAELLDLVARPAALSLCALALPGAPTAALLVGSCLADAAYYGVAARGRSSCSPSSSISSSV